MVSGRGELGVRMWGLRRLIVTFHLDFNPRNALEADHSYSFLRFTMGYILFQDVSWYPSRA